MKAQRLLQIGGIMDLLLVAFHLSFWKLFDWQHDLVGLSLDNHAIMQMLNVQLTYALAVFGILSLFFSGELVSTTLGRVTSLAIAGAWILRGLDQVIFWGLSLAASWGIILVCLVGTLLYLIPVIGRRRPNG